MAELAKAIDRDESVTDLRDLFARHAQQTDPTESAWFVAEPEPEPVYAAEGGDDLARFGVEELGGVVVEVTESAELDEKRPAPRPAALPPRKKTRRRKVSIFDVPESDEQPIQVPNWPLRQPEPEPVPVKKTPEVRQLALF